MIRMSAFAAALLLAACQVAKSPADEARARPRSGWSRRSSTRPTRSIPTAMPSRSRRGSPMSRSTSALDFDAKRVAGTAALDIIAKPGVREIVLDSKGLEIAKVTDAAGKPLQHMLGAGDEAKGAPLTVALAATASSASSSAMRSAPDAEALQWLSPEQTAGKQHPYLFSQGQPTLNRTWIPTQDSPGIRQTWERADHRARAAQGGDVGRAPDPGRRSRRRGPPRLPLPDGQAGRALSDRDRRRRHRLPRARARAPASGPSRRCSTGPPPSWPTPSGWSRRPRSSTAPIAGAATT